jgi:hypothetical protein
MLDPDIQYTIFDLVPSTFIDDTVSAVKLSNTYEVNKYPGLVIAVQFIDFNEPYFRSCDDYGTVNEDDDTVDYKEYLQATLRLIVGADDEAEATLSNTFTYLAATSYYRLTEPVTGTITVTDGTTTFVEDTDYEVSANGLDITWLGVSTPVEETTFTVTYVATRRANWTVGKVLKELNTWVKSDLEGEMRTYDISIPRRTDITDLTKMVGEDVVVMKAFSVRLVYPDTWQVSIDGASTPLESVDVDLEDISITIN